MTTLFSLGHIIMTANLKRTLVASGSADNIMQELQGLLNRHASGDWSDLVKEDWELNQKALETGGASSPSTPPPKASSPTSSPRLTAASPPVSSANSNHQ